MRLNWTCFSLVVSLLLSVPTAVLSSEPTEKKTSVPFENSTNKPLTFDFSLNDAYAMGGKPKPVKGVYVVGPKQKVTFELPSRDEMSFRWKTGKKKSSDDGGAFLDLKDGKVSVLCYDSSDGIMCGQGGG